MVWCAARIDAMIVTSDRPVLTRCARKNVVDSLTNYSRSTVTAMWRSSASSAQTRGSPWLSNRTSVRRDSTIGEIVATKRGEASAMRIWRASDLDHTKIRSKRLQKSLDPRTLTGQERRKCQQRFESEQNQRVSSGHVTRRGGCLPRGGVGRRVRPVDGGGSVPRGW